MRIQVMANNLNRSEPKKEINRIPGHINAFAAEKGKRTRTAEAMAVWRAIALMDSDEKIRSNDIQ
jgi:hypothetical protein